VVESDPKGFARRPVLNRPYGTPPPQKSLFPQRDGRPGKGRRKRSFFGGIVRFFLLLTLGGIAGGAGVAAQSYLFFTHNLPSVEKLKNYAPPIVTQFYSDDGKLIAEFASERRFVVSIDRIPKMVQNAFVAAEDQNFWTHQGVDKEAIARAIKDNLKEWHIGSGASTITQQVAKTFFLTRKRTFCRKIREAILATRMEKRLDKAQILNLYLNQIYFGSSAYGVEAAARTYFGKSVRDLTVAEAAMLAGLPKGPSIYSPKRKKNMKRSLERRAYVLGRMLEDGYIDRTQYEDAMKEAPKLVTRTNPYRRIAPDFVEHVRRYIEKKYGADTLNKGGLQVYTTVSLDLTMKARKAVEWGLEQLDRRQGYRGPIETLNLESVKKFLEDQTRSRKEPLHYGDVTQGVVTHIDEENVYVHMGNYVKGKVNKEYVGKIRIDPEPSWWVRKPYVRSDMRTRNFAEGDLPFQVGDRILVRLIDPNVRRKELYLRKYGKKDPQLKNYKNYTEDMLSYFPLEVVQKPIVEAALMLKRNRTGYIKVLLGGRDYKGSQYNRATQARRQPGSSFKPVIFAAALNKGFTCADVILDSPLALSIPGTGEVWRPKNYRGGYRGPVSFRQAIVKSINIPTIKILQQIGLDQAKAYARKLGYTSPLAKNLTMALGSNGVSLEEQLNAYSVFPNRGYLIPGVYIRKIIDRNGKVIEEHPPPVLLDDPMQTDQQPQIRQISHDPNVPGGTAEVPERGAPFLRRRIDEGTAFIMTSLLQGVVREGTATILKKIVGRPDIAGKTGTTNENVDAWFMGFSPDYTCGVWVGFDDEKSLGRKETGGKAAAPIWGLFMKEVLAETPVKPFPTSEAVEYRNIDPRTGLTASGDSGFKEVFKIGSGPGEMESGLAKGAGWDYTGSDLDQF
jgi:penicillin-binding protein 1A